MKALFALLFIFTTLSASAGLVRDLYPGTTFVFRHDVILTEGQTDLLVGDRRCRLDLGRVARTYNYLPYRSQLVIKEVSVKEMEEGLSPYGHRYRTIPEIKITFEDSKNVMECRGDDILEMDASEFEIDGVFDILPPYHSYNHIWV